MVTQRILFPFTADQFNAKVCVSAVYQEAAVLIAPLVADCLPSLLGQSDCLQETLSSRLSLLIKLEWRPSMLFKDRGSSSRRCGVVGARFTRSAAYSVMWAGRFLLFNLSCHHCRFIFPGRLKEPPFCFKRDQSSLSNLQVAGTKWGQLA